jgi:hypothetical protein
MLVAVLHFIRDDEDPQAIVDRLVAGDVSCNGVIARFA